MSSWTVALQAPLSRNSPGKNAGVGCHALLQGNLPDPADLVTKRVRVLGGLDACRSEASKEARSVERKVCFISDAGNQGGRVADICPKADFLPPTRRGESFYKQRRGVACRNSTVICNSHLQIGHQWSASHHLGCFRTVS